MYSLLPMTRPMSRADFESHRSSVFTVELEGNGITLRLSEVADKTPPGFPGEQFSLIFEGPIHPPLDQRIHRLEHDTLGVIDLFLVPVGSTGTARRYEAFFNLMTI